MRYAALLSGVLLGMLSACRWQAPLVVTEEIYYDDAALTRGKLSVFLAGPSSHERWRPEAIRLLREGGFKGTIVVPEFRDGVFRKERFDDGKPGTIPKMTRASENIMRWETDGIDNATVLVVWMPYTDFADDRKWTGLSTRGESSRAIEAKRRGLVLGMPDDAFRSGQDRFHAHRRGLLIHASLQETIAAALRELR